MPSRRVLFQCLAAAAVTGAGVPSLDAALPVDPSRRKLTALSTANPSITPVFLDHNENAYGPSEKVRAALAEAPSLANRYPRNEYDALRNKLAALYLVKEDHVLLACGSSEILRVAASALLASGKRLVQALPTYPTLGKFARDLGADVVEVPLTKLYEHDLDSMLKRVDARTSLVYICNPNNPTATLTTRKDLDTFVRQLPDHVHVLIDEAYSDFVSPHAGYASFLESPVNDPRVVVCRTFSKVYGLAGMRVGYAVGSPDTLKRMGASQLRYGVSTIAAKAALTAVEDSEYVKIAIKRNADDRQEFMNQVNIRMLRAIDSHANFALLNPLRPTDAVLDHLKQNNIFVAPLIPAMDKYIRVSFGVPEEIREFWRVMDQLPPTGKMAM